MAQQGTQEQPADQEDSGKHRSPEGDQQSTSGEEQSSSGSSGKQEAAPSEQPTEKQEAAPSEQPTEKQQAAPSEQPTQKQQAAPAGQQRGRADTSWAESEEPHRRSLDVGELAWRTGNVIATVVRTLALLFALVLIVNVVLILVGVNPANGVAQFIGGVADVVILGFRDLFVPANPTVGLIVNSLIAAVFWAFVGEFLSRLIRFLAARVK